MNRKTFGTQTQICKMGTKFFIVHAKGIKRANDRQYRRNLGARGICSSRYCRIRRKMCSILYYLLPPSRFSDLPTTLKKGKRVWLERRAFHSPVFKFGLFPNLNIQSCNIELLVVRDFDFWAVWAAGPVLKKKLGADYE